ncbi:hypothetical protein PRK78_004535 [Emydomyces testavorans]|uniref:CENP-V/GFA domain-containing protein n=1 Tax=Emydomyces testavorans TaxID=2070801 RepID=A0AAF0IJP3_9EURO|nr:hypothetical protein PRK78_004535 [Emydomyces testavorans]
MADNQQPSSSSPSSPAHLRPYTGSCHCGAIRYRVLLDPHNLNPARCNCSICHKKGNLILEVADPSSSFTLLQPSSWASPELGDYTFGEGRVHHYFCKTCGVSVFTRGTYVVEGTEVEFLSVNGLTVDQGSGKEEGEGEGGGLDLRKVKIGYWNGREDDWKSGMRGEPYPGGCV